MGCANPLRRGVRRTPSVSSRFGSKLPLPLYADVRLHITMTYRNDVIRYSDKRYAHRKFLDTRVTVVRVPNNPNAELKVEVFLRPEVFAMGDVSSMFGGFMLTGMLALASVGGNAEANTGYFQHWLKWNELSDKQSVILGNRIGTSPDRLAAVLALAVSNGRDAAPQPPGLAVDVRTTSL